MINRWCLPVSVLLCSVVAFAQVAAETADLRPVTIRVVDAGTSKPVPGFEYFYRVQAPGDYRGGDWNVWVPVESADGTFDLLVPKSCELSLGVRAPGYVYDTLYVQRYNVVAGETKLPIVHSLQRGQTVSGTVVSKGSGEPIVGARISPTIFQSPSSVPDYDRSVWSGDHGRFTIHGIGPMLGSIVIEHEEYLDATFYLYDGDSNEPRDTSDVIIKLPAGETVFGKVTDHQGKPVSGATVNAGDKQVRTAGDGTFRLKGVRRSWGHGDFDLHVEMGGYMKWWATPSDMPADGFRIVLEPLFEISGRVESSEGKPVESFLVMAGPGRNPAVFRSGSVQINDADGRFTITIDTDATRRGGLASDGGQVEPEHWLAVRADGHAVWEGWVPFGRDLRPVIVKLQAGVTVSGSLAGIGSGFKGGEAELVPMRPPSEEYMITDNSSQEIATLQTRIAADGAFRFEHVRPDTYTLRVSGSEITTKTISVLVPASEVALEPIAVEASGSIRGRIFRRDGQPWAFASGVLYHDSEGAHGARYFKTDELGNFSLDRVPADEVRVGAQYLGGCIVYSDLVTVRVGPGETVNVTVNDQDRSNDARFRVIIGDGSDAQHRTGTGMGAARLIKNVTTGDPAFRIELEPMTTGSLVLPDMDDWQIPDKDGLITIPNVPPGAYRLRVFDWLLTRGFRDGLLHEADIDVTSAMDPVEVRLGAGAITGRLITTGDVKRMPQVIAVETRTGTPVRRARCDSNGDFCVRYLPPGRYELRGHEQANGTCRVGPIEVQNDVTDTGEHTLVAGSTIQGTVRLATTESSPTTVRAIDARGRSVDALDFEGRDGETYSIANLWPGTWKVQLLHERSVPAEVQVGLTQGETATTDLVLEPARP